MASEDCWFITLTNGRDPDIWIRRRDWHGLLTRMKQRWPDCEAATVIEYTERRGVHLHAVVKRAPDLDPIWLMHLLAVAGHGTKLGDFRGVHDSDGLAPYLVKQLTVKVVVDGWPRHFRPVTTTRGWARAGTPSEVSQ
jgi:hypothetical protein